MAGKVTVACKVPMGLRFMHGKKRKESDQLVPDGDQTEVVLNGANHPDAVAGYGLTEVDADLFDDWAKEHKDFPPLKHKLIFAQPKADDAKAEAREKRGVKTGVEGIDPEKPAPTLAPDKETMKGK